ncbi:hypothetical protein E0765_07650 [Sulfuricurvum sp. IAE1]|uniref:DUF2780 domain-containing protein n=1 Tax=Sulfuricurvum sp. IAE1 TaxID=2546102 RepID=UPI00104A3412|nr:DUF2780 domain-containing protein [Sulfuricurvum sp. IAE1]TDA63319.1 hypothetical protein E0765_07650 [Sulfuricurvum sp. IAE1]
MRNLIHPLTALTLIASQAQAIDFGGLIQSVAPVAQSAAPVVDASLASNPLIKNITTTLGVTPTQAVGGAAAILNDAKSTMKPTDYAALTKQLPPLAAIVSAAPAVGSGSVASKFSALGMDPSLIAKFTPLILEYIQTGTTPGMAKLVQTALAE